MINSKVEVSVCMTTYNHEKYIKDSIDSVLNQTFRNFELVIVNDGSTDETANIIKTFNDPRIKYIEEDNSGPSIAFNKAIHNSSGKYIAFMSGDDISLTDRLEKQINYIKSDKDCKALFSWVNLINENGDFFDSIIYPQTLFNVTSKLKTELLHDLFFQGNSLCAVTSFIEREVLENTSLFIPTLIQLQDFELWLSIIKMHNIHVISEPLVNYRIRDRNANLSFNPDYFSRGIFETHRVYQSFFSGVDSETFRGAFFQYLKNKNFMTDIEYQLEKSFIYLNHSVNYIKLIAIEKLSILMQNELVRSVAKDNYKFTISDFFNLSTEVTIFMENQEKLIYEISALKLENNHIKNSKLWKIINLFHRIKKNLKDFNYYYYV